MSWLSYEYINFIQIMAEKKKQKTETIEINTKEMAEAGLHFGHRASKLHPKMKSYVCGVKNTTHLIDLEKAVLKLKEALEFIKNLISEGKTLLLVGTKIQIQDPIKEMAKDLSLPYVNQRWLGGTLTNFEELQKRIDYFKDLEKKKKEGELEKYTKRERMKIAEELGKLEQKFGGLKDLKKLPDAVFVFDMKKDKLACKEAERKGIKIIGIADTNIDPTLADFPIPANDDAISSLNYILGKVREAIVKGKEEVKGRQEEVKESQEVIKD